MLNDDTDYDTALQICNISEEILEVAKSNGLEANILEGLEIRRRNMKVFLKKQRFKDAVDMAAQIVSGVDFFEKQNAKRLAET